MKVSGWWLNRYHLPVGEDMISVSEVRKSLKEYTSPTISLLYAVSDSIVEH